MSTGIEWTRERILERYKRFKKNQDILVFDLQYIPYWLIRIKGSYHAKWIRPRELEEQYYVVNEITGEPFRVLTMPKLTEEDNKAYIDNLNIGVKNEEKALLIAQKSFLKFFNKKYNSILRPHMTISILHTEIQMIVKPYWVLHNGKDIDFKNVMVVDGITGKVGVEESASIIKFWSKCNKENNRS